MDLIAPKWIALTGQHLRNFKQKGKDLWNFACPICGDSRRDKNKSRGYIYRKDDVYRVHCHNCGYHTTFRWFLREHFPDISKDYTLDLYRNDSPPLSKKFIKTMRPAQETHPEIVEKFEDERTRLFRKLVERVDTLSPAHEAVKYCRDRMIPHDKWDRLYYLDDISKIHQLSSKYRDKITGTEPRLVLPAFNKRDKLIGINCRALNAKGLRYVVVRINQIEPMIFGLNHVDFDKPIYCVEGAIDSLFLPNAVATGSTNVHTMIGYTPIKNMIVALDNQPRNRDIVRIMTKLARQGFTLVLWPEEIEEKDINEMVLAGRTPGEILDIMNENKYHGLRLDLELSKWRKV